LTYAFERPAAQRLEVSVALPVEAQAQRGSDRVDRGYLTLLQEHRQSRDGICRQGLAGHSRRAYTLEELGFELVVIDSNE
jgi:hypothetical protein